MNLHQQRSVISATRMAQLASLPSVQLSVPLYTWEGCDSGDRVSYDRSHERLVHQQEGGFFAIDCRIDGSARDGIFVKWERLMCDTITFSPDGVYFAYVLSDHSTVGITGVLDTLQPDIRVPLGRPTSDHMVLGLMWLPEASSDWCELVVASTAGLEMFKFTYESRTVRSLKRFTTPAKHVWFEASSGYMVLAIGPRSLQPYFFYCKNPTKLPKIELNLPRWQTLDTSDVAVLTMYGTTYCARKDASTGRVSLRCLSGSMQADVVLDTQGPGSIDFSVVDNLLLVHRKQRHLTFFFDPSPGACTAPQRQTDSYARAASALCKPARLAVRPPDNAMLNSTDREGTGGGEVFTDVELRTTSLGRPLYSHCRSAVPVMVCGVWGPTYADVWVCE
eukprot:GHVQ01026304.1.p1 GENE.GHVQ01026304.1~~GHVQ01026304.1.p1  ORF type:complete len:391 (-),score=40.44 GHVQ01026304.1:165-1337(-)